MIQHRAARFVVNRPWTKYYHHDSVSSMLSDLKWPSLQIRLLYKLFHDYQTVPHHYLPTRAPLNTRANHNHKLQHYQTRSNVYKFSFFPRTVPEWNELSLDQVSAENLEQFKLLIN